MRNFKLKQLFLILLLITGVSCGKKEENRTYGPGTGGGGIGNPGYLAPGLNERAPFAQKYQMILSHPDMACKDSWGNPMNVPRVQVGFTMRVTQGIPQVVGMTPNYDLANVSDVKGLYVGSTPENDVVVVKDYGTTKDVIISLCDIDGWGNAISDIVFSPYESFHGSNVTSCSVNQISKFNFGIVYPYSPHQPIFMQVAPINGGRLVEGVCPFDFYSDPIQ